uniref:Phytocyanin domain-containing protein n=1 Tax=Kalanchoe fedtschenkoi TaxID=63787 RepID=A0A7N0UTF8_KALFE
MAKGYLTAVSLVMVVAIMAPCIDAFSHIVGGSLGWAVPPNATYYDEWAASPRIFGVGDKLVFPYRPGQYNVYQVNKNDFDNCTQVAPISMYARGPTTYYLSGKGDYFFYSAIAKHCELGTKLHISVTSDTEGTSGDRFSFELAPETAPTPSPHERQLPLIGDATVEKQNSEEGIGAQKVLNYNTLCDESRRGSADVHPTARPGAQQAKCC